MKWAANASQGRLQRPPDFTGERLDRFSQVWLRHGLPGALLGALCLTLPDMRALLGQGLANFSAAPLLYLSAGALILAVLSAFTWLLDRRIDAAAFGWIVYLLALSLWEEWLFRLALPGLLQSADVGLRAAVIISSLAFGLMHYFTLRWKWHWCVGAFLGGMALSRLLNSHFDLAIIVAVHWIATFANTPRPPGRMRQARADRESRE